jgi:DNA-binding MarR family transcriptional regulator/ribosomal protein S18 acetylase RimI-like enzyme
MPSHPELDRRIAAIRGFNRFYTKQIGVLQDGLLGSEFSLAEARLLYELALRDQPTASELGKELDLDAGYLSRMLRSFEQRGLLQKTPAAADKRQSLLSLTALGRSAFAPLDARARAEIASTLGLLTEPQQRRLLAAMATIEATLTPGPARRAEPPFLLRPHRPGDMGWVIGRHAALYAEEYGWNEEFEAFVAEIAAKFIRNFDPKRERCWIAEIDGAIVGSGFLVRQSRTIAQLRMLLVEPQARGLGIGRKLVDECVRFAQQAGYRKITLWTNSVLGAARRLYAETGFELLREEPHQSFGQDLIGQIWEFDLKKWSDARARRLTQRPL